MRRKRWKTKIHAPKRTEFRKEAEGSRVMCRSKKLLKMVDRNNTKRMRLER